MEARVAVLGHLRVPPERLAELRPPLKALVDATRAHDGCLAYDVGEDPFEPGLIRFSELWPDHETLERHLQAPHIAPWRAAVGAAGAAGVIDRRFTIFDVTGSRTL